MVESKRMVNIAPAKMMVGRLLSFWGQRPIFRGKLAVKLQECNQHFFCSTVLYSTLGLFAMHGNKNPGQPLSPSPEKKPRNLLTPRYSWLVNPE